MKTRVTMPLFQALLVAVSFCVVVGGLFMMTWGLAWLLDLDWDVRAYLLAWIGLVIIAWLASAAARHVLGGFVEHQPRSIQALAVTAGLLVLGLAVGSLLLTVRERFGLELASMVVGAGVVLGFAALGYNQAQDLVAGYWRRSPFEEEISRQILPAFAKMLEGGAGEQQDVRKEDPRWMERGQRPYGIIARPIGVQRPEVEDWDEYREDEEVELVSIDPEAGNLIWFVRFAARRPSLTLRDLTVRPAPMLPFPEGDKQRRLHRDMIRRLLARGSTEGKIRVDGHEEYGMGDGGFWRLGGQGATAEWTMDKLEARLRALEMWRTVYGDELPVPDYHAADSEMERAA